MVWLTIVCSIVVFCAIAGQVIATVPRLSRLLRLVPHGRLPERPASNPAAVAAGAGDDIRGNGSSGVSGTTGTTGTTGTAGDGEVSDPDPASRTDTASR